MGVKFVSFSQQIKAIKSKKLLEKKGTDNDVEISHFLSSFSHHKEINLSANFTKFADNVEGISQTLPQLIYNKEKIFSNLEEFINLHDPYSLQPLLDLLSHFIHDLGPDFMPFYGRALQTLIDVALKTEGNPDIIQWTFSCLAFVFKYLNRLLREDLIPTFKALLPLLSLTKKEYLSKFCSEALSFLIRKSNYEKLSEFVNESFINQKEIIEENASYRNALIIMYSEAMKNTTGILHSNFSNILQSLFDNIFIISYPKFNSIIADILLKILNHGTLEECKSIYEFVTKNLVKVLAAQDASIQDLISINFMITTLAFAESGKKVSDWNMITSTTTVLIEKAKDLKGDSSLYAILIDSILYTFAVILRNCDQKELVKYHIKIFKSALELNDGASFLPFIESAMFLTKQRTISFGSSYVQEFINQKWNTRNFDVQISLFLTNSFERDWISKEPGTDKIHVIIPHDFYQSILTNMNNFEIETSHDLAKIYWQLLILRHTKGVNDSKGLIHLLDQLTDPEFKFASKFSEDLIGAILNSLAAQNLDDLNSFEILSNILTNFDRFKKSSIYTFSVSNFIKSLKNKPNSISYLKDNLVEFVLLVTENLSYSNTQSRSNSLDLIVSTLEVCGLEVSNIITQSKLIEQIPLTLQNGRNIALRIRNLAIEFNKTASDPLITNVVARYFFGLLTVKFSPTWEAVYEVLPSIANKISGHIWNLSYDLIKKNYRSQDEVPYFFEDISYSIFRDDVSDWVVSDHRLRDNFSACNSNFAKYSHVNKSIIDYAENKRANINYSDIMRSQAIKALAAVPSIGESHSQLLVPLLLNEELEDADESEDLVLSSSWSVKDRNSLIQLFTKFNKMTKLHRSEDVYSYMLNLLCNKATDIQKLALDCLINWKNPHINKYKDNLRNLLDDTVFKDEISKFITKDETNIIEDGDVSYLMPVVLRILFGRAQTSKSGGGNKQGRKFAVFTILPNLSDNHIKQFLELGSSRIGFRNYFEKEDKEISLDVISDRLLRRISGFVNLLLEAYNILGQNFHAVLSTTIEPLLYSLCVAQKAIENKSHYEDSATLDKAARNIRQSGMKALSELFELLGENVSWSPYVSFIFESIISSRLVKFSDENLQQPSSLMKLIVNWINFKSHNELLFVDEFAPVKAMLSLLGHESAKEPVLSVVLDFCLAAVKANSTDERYFYLVALVVDSSLKTLPDIFLRMTNKEINSKAVALLLSLVENQYIDDNQTRKSLIDALCGALDRSNNHVENKDKAHILTSLSSLVENFNCSFEDVSSLYKVCSKSFKNFSDLKIRANLVQVFKSFGNRFIEYEEVAILLENLNAFTSKNMGEPDFERRLDAYKTINEAKFKEFTPLQWLPIIYCSLFFINDENELALRTNSKYTLNRFVDCFSGKTSIEEAEPFIRQFKDIILPNVRIGIRSYKEAVQTEFISFIAYAVENSKYFIDFDDMKVLLYNGDEEANFFLNINHIQIHRRQRAVRRLRESSATFSSGSISHYLIPMIEHYAFASDEKLRNVGNETVVTIGELVVFMSWNQFKALFRRYVSNLTTKKDHLKDSVNLLVSVAQAYNKAIQSRRNGQTSDLIKDMPTGEDDINTYVLKEVSPTIMKVLAKRDDETAPSRIPLSEALVSLVICLSEDLVVVELPGILTTICQIMKSKSEDLRNAVRKSLAKIAKILGAKYIRFILKELKGALSRGSQIRVLSFSYHSLLVSMSDILEHGDLDDSSELIVDVIMENIFGDLKEETHKAYSTAELLSGNISLTKFGTLINPIKSLLKERISLQTQNKLDELLRRFALGLNLNSEASSRDLLLLCYELHQQSVEILGISQPEKKKDDIQDHFLVKLTSRPVKTQKEYSVYVYTLQKFAFELLKTAISRHESLLTISNMEGFIPLLKQGLHSENEGVVVSCLRVLSLVVKLPFAKETEVQFSSCVRRVLNMIKDSPNTKSELSQSCLKFLAVIVRHKPNIKLKESSITYVLLRIQPDLEEPHRQGLAFNFLKSVISQHIMVPEVYDVMDKVSNIMITNHTKEIRDMSRSVYFQFLMEYDQSKGRLEKQFKFLIDNLEYPAESGRQSIMELIHLIFVKSGPEFLQKLASSFFVALAHTIINDDSSKCREMAISLISTLFKKLNGNLGAIENYCVAWLNQTNNSQLVRCGLHIYKIFITEFGFEKESELHELALKCVKRILKASKNIENDEANENEVEWDSVYLALRTFGSISDKNEKMVFGSEFKDVWSDIIDCLLFPHSWVRSASCRIVGALINKMDKLSFKFTEYEIQTIAYRLLRQLSAPSISEALGTQIVSNLTQITIRWERENVLFIKASSSLEEVSKDDDSNTSLKYASDWVTDRISAIIRNEGNANESFVSKKSAIQFSAMLIQLLSLERLKSVAEKIILSLYNIMEMEAVNDQENELKEIACECSDMIQKKLGISDYTQCYSNVQKIVNSRRQDRRTKRAQLAITAPELSARRKLKKHERSREKRKHEKDDNGYYHSKKRVARK